MSGSIIIFFLLFGALWAGDLKEIKSFIHNTVQGINVEHDHRLCGFGQMAEVRLRYDELDAGAQLMADQLLAEMNAQITTASPAGYFALHYDTSGSDAVDSEDISGNGIPDFIDSAGVILDHVWDVEINQLGFKRPLNSIGEPAEVYNIYFKNLINIYGETVLARRFDRPEGIIQFSSFINMDNDFSSGFYTKGIEALKVTAAHEFNHAIQLAYHINGGYSIDDLFFMEMTSTWLEDFIYDDINDYYQYLDAPGGLFDGFYQFSFNSMYNLDPYANCLYMHMVESEYGPEICVKFWETIPQAEAVAAMDQVLQEEGSSFAVEQNRYAAWLYFTGERAIQGRYFEEAADYPQFDLQINTASFNDDLAVMGMKVYQIPLDEKGWYRSTLNAQSGNGMFNHIDETELIGEPAYFQNSQKVSKKSTGEFLLVLTNSDEYSPVNVDYNISAVSLVVSPNPVVVEQSIGQVLFNFVPPGSVIRIYDVLGRRVQTLYVEEGGTQIHWNLRDAHHRNLPSSMYFYHIKANSLNTTGKLVIVR